MSSEWWALITALLAAAAAGGASLLVGWWTHRDTALDRIASRYAANMLALGGDSVRAHVLAEGDMEKIAAEPDAGVYAQLAQQALDARYDQLARQSIERGTSGQPGPVNQALIRQPRTTTAVARDAARAEPVVVSSTIVGMAQRKIAEADAAGHEPRPVDLVIAHAQVRDLQDSAPATD